MRLPLQTLLSSEMRLLCASCRVRPNDTDFGLQALLASQVDSKELMALAIRHRIEPLLLHNLKRHKAGIFSDDLISNLATRVRRNAIKSLQAIRTNLQLARAMRARGIEYLPFKGVTVAQRYYGSVSLRHTNDIDFWVPESKVEAAREVLCELGCRVDKNHDFQDIEAMGERHRRHLRRRLCEDAWDMPDGTRLELHWRLTLNAKGLLLDPADLLVFGESIEVGGCTLTMISPVPLLLYLCEHGARHGWYRLKWLMDLPQVLESQDWDWAEVLAEAKRANCLSALLLGLKLAQTLFGWGIPEQVHVMMARRRMLDWQVKMVCRNLNKPEAALAVPTVIERMVHLSYRASLVESSGFVWNEIAFYFLSHNDLRLARLPDRWFWVYYVLRPMLVGYKIYKHWRLRRLGYGQKASPQNK